MKTKLAIIAFSVFTATSSVADTVSVEKPAATMRQTQNQKEEGSVPGWVIFLTVSGLWIGYATLAGSKTHAALHD